MGDIPVVRGVEPFEAFFRREYRPVLGLAIALSGSRSVAEELTQDAFLATLRQWDRVGTFDNPGTWVRRVVANRSVSAWRRATAEARAVVKLRGLRRDTSFDLDAGMDVWREVAKLPRRQAQAVALTYFADLPRRDVAEILDCSEETVKTHLERARRTLADRLAPRTEDEHERR